MAIINNKKMYKNLFNNIYEGKKVLITGNTGFKGSWLSLWLSKMGAEIIGYSKGIISKPNHFDVLDLKINQIEDNILNKKKIFEVINKFKPDIIFHMAAQTIVRESYKNPLETIETNIIGTTNILEGCRKTNGVKAIINITSDKCYKNQEFLWGYRENDPMGGDDPYSASKGCAELVSQAYRKSFFQANKNNLPTTLLANVRAGNVIGGGDWAKDRLIPDLIRAASKNNKTIIRSPNATRPWQHVLEPLSGYLHLGWKLLEGKKEFAEDWNFGPGEDACLTVENVIRKSQKYWDKIKYQVQINENNPHEANILKLDSSKAKIKLKWKNVWDEKMTIKKTIEWYKKYYQNVINSDKDLEEYIKNAKQKSIDWAKS